ncbi:parallel beta-helix repeat protein [Mucilaginibacter yixingensis]|uniref:Parallel beta-helix repeat protein n=1 Tax=Mucilaginibacter yixingensis TaxID=1295612 RepID=A0A2T5JG83_9SPHI|nr:right-handed parallel beta-helix repeat-containing protein [Mucilaginibacter yixingensis]PTR01442.1 parallel beta-helix repeat protein [Mucilaginibacter yixingensis]
MLAPVYTKAAAITLNGAHDITISGKSIVGGNVPCITLQNCYNVHITGNKLSNAKAVGVYLYNCKNITVDHNYITNVSSGVYADQSVTGGIVVTYNEFYNMQGPFPRGQFVQFNNVNGKGNAISFNVGENILGKSYAEDAISLYESNGTADSPILINGNRIRGGGPSPSGGGIMLGDNGGSYQLATNNTLVNPGQYGMAIAGGDHNSIVNNTIFGAQQSFTNVGIYVSNTGKNTVSNARVSGNQVCFYNKVNYQNNCWLAPGTAKPDGWDDTNQWGTKLDASILPATLF